MALYENRHNHPNYDYERDAVIERPVEKEKVTNKAGIKPLEFNVLVEVDEVDEKSAGGIILPDVVRDTEQVAATTGTVLDVSKTAFTFEDGAEIVAPGDSIAFARYAGMKVKGADGEQYLIIKDKDVSAVYR